jgi:hypothetical protein
MLPEKLQTRTVMLAIGTAALLAYGCSDTPDLESKGSTSAKQESDERNNDGSDPRGFQSDGQRFGNLQTVRKQLVAIPDEIDIEPLNGQLFPGRRVQGMSVHFRGFTVQPNQTVEVQVLNSASASISEQNWVTIGSTTSSATGTTFNDKDAIFQWSLDAVPSEDRTRWEQGGILRYRTVATDSKGTRTALPYYDLNAGDCIQKQNGKSWKDTLKACKSGFSPNIGDALANVAVAATLVSPTPQPRDQFDPNYLSRRGFIDTNETDDYYDEIDAPQSLDDFAHRFGFDDPNESGFFDNSFDNEDVASGAYYNLGDLGLGREIHCKRFSRDGQRGVACITKNYGVDNNNKPDFSGDAESAMDDNLAHQNSFAAVCMIKFGDTFAPPEGNDVQFMVYGADGAIVNSAQLDSIASNVAIPNNCLNCHGGKYDRSTRTVVGASFLPYDPESFLWSDQRGFTYQDQEDDFRALNQMVKESGAPPGTAMFIDGMYGNKVDQVGAKANFDWIPPGWSTSQEAKNVYEQAYKHYCRTCHTSQIGDFAFINYNDFKLTAQKTQEDICQIGEMPVCEGTMQQFWQSSARAYLINSIGVSDSCTPNDGRNDQ